MSTTSQSNRKHRTGLSRIAAACERCRKRKQKCDAKRPSCGPCSAIGVECIMSDRLVVYQNSNCSCDELRSKVSELQAQIQSLNEELVRERDRNIHLSSLGSTDTLQAVDHGSASLQSSLHTHNIVETVVPDNAMCYRILRPTFTGSDDRQGADIDRLGLAWRLWHNDTSTETPFQNASSVDSVPVREYGQELVDVFFNNCWAHLPILHKPTFLRDHYEPVAQGAPTSPLSTYQVYMVFAVASGSKATTSTGYTFAHRDFFQRAINDLRYVMTLSDMEYLQCLLLMCVYGRNEPQCVNMWHTTGLALRTALSLNLHHQESVVRDNLFESEMAKRLFWSSYVMDRSMAIAMGRPLAIQDSDITTQLPLQHTDDQLTSPIPFIQTTTPNTKDTTTFIHVIKLRRLNADIYQAFHSAANNHLAEEQLHSLRSQFNEQLNHWLVTAPRYMLAASMQQSPEWFQIAYHHAVLSLNRPSYATPVPSLASLRLCADASISLISCYGSLYAKNKVSYSFIALNSIFMAAITMLYTLRASSAVRQELSKAVTQTNINTCLSLFQGISGGREIAVRCSQIVGRLGQAALLLFDREEEPSGHVDLEFMSWFGLKTRHNGTVNKNSESAREGGLGGDGGIADRGTGTNHQQGGWQQQPQASNDLLDPPTSMSIESAWQDFFAPDFDFEGSTNLDLFPMAML